jgi:hypothetical protein
MVLCRNRVIHRETGQGALLVTVRERFRRDLLSLPSLAAVFLQLLTPRQNQVVGYATRSVFVNTFITSAL